GRQRPPLRWRAPRPRAAGAVPRQAPPQAGPPPRRPTPARAPRSQDGPEPRGPGLPLQIAVAALDRLILIDALVDELRLGLHVKQQLVLAHVRHTVPQ